MVSKGLTHQSLLWPSRRNLRGSTYSKLHRLLSWVRCQWCIATKLDKLCRGICNMFLKRNLVENSSIGLTVLLLCGWVRSAFMKCLMSNLKICFSFNSLSMLCYIRLLDIHVQLFAFNVTLNQGKNNDIVFLLHSTSRFNSRLELALNDNHIKSLLKSI